MHSELQLFCAFQRRRFHRARHSASCAVWPRNAVLELRKGRPLAQPKNPERANLPWRVSAAKIMRRVGQATAPHTMVSGSAFVLSASAPEGSTLAENVLVTIPLPATPARLGGQVALILTGVVQLTGAPSATTVRVQLSLVYPNGYTVGTLQRASLVPATPATAATVTFAITAPQRTCLALLRVFGIAGGVAVDTTATLNVLGVRSSAVPRALACDSASGPSAATAQADTTRVAGSLAAGVLARSDIAVAGAQRRCVLITASVDLRQTTIVAPVPVSVALAIVRRDAAAPVTQQAMVATVQPSATRLLVTLSVAAELSPGAYTVSTFVAPAGTAAIIADVLMASLSVAKTT
jgi:hypothetical protein